MIGSSSPLTRSPRAWSRASATVPPRITAMLAETVNAACGRLPSSRSPFTSSYRRAL